MSNASTRTVRAARPSDAVAVREISAEAYIPIYQAVIGAVPKPAHEDYAGRIERGEVWILEADGGPAGVLVLEPQAGHLTVYSIAVRPRHQGRGYGKLLLAFAEQRAAAEGLAELRLYTNSRMGRNLALYRGCGFSETGLRPHPIRPGEVVVDMAKAVSGTPADPNR